MFLFEDNLNNEAIGNQDSPKAALTYRKESLDYFDTNFVGVTWI
jgi:hypothetical protein